MTPDNPLIGAETDEAMLVTAGEADGGPTIFFPDKVSFAKAKMGPIDIFELGFTLGETTMKFGISDDVFDALWQAINLAKDATTVA